MNLNVFVCECTTEVFVTSPFTCYSTNIHLYHRHTAPKKFGPKHKNKDTIGKGWSADQFSESWTAKHHHFENLDFGPILRVMDQSTAKHHHFENLEFCMADELKALPVHRTKPYKSYNFQSDDTSWYFGL